MERVVRILMNRDGISREEAMEIALDVKSEMLEAIEAGDYSEAESIFEDELGLEPDYIPAFLL